ncbi:MAG: 4-hydroxy-tetrahydrodipicolinate reductase [Kangiellaceae bacterium]|jgi:4-hydroxy-tetrahydrodipicolinate reductase|nr:4-hydroxy-tetrahydrodipicolinate reductase [Kangiellaceae bacterium]
MTNIAVNACTGRMGQELLFAIDRDPHSTLSAPLLRSGHKWVGATVASQFPSIHSQTPLTDDLTQAAADSDVLIDFSLPDYSIETAIKCAELGLPVVIGTTGFSYQQKQQLESLAQQIPILTAPNMSVGVNLSLKLLELVAKTIGQEADIELIEAHHRYKKDSPSGTALRMGEAIANGLDKVFSEIAAFDRCGKDAVRQPGSIGFSAIRAGNIVGEHTALFALAGEEIEITHKARDRQTFAQGALRAAHWLKQQTNGHYDMLDVLGLKSLNR